VTVLIFSALENFLLTYLLTHSPVNIATFETLYFLSVESGETTSAAQKQLNGSTFYLGEDSCSPKNIVFDAGFDASTGKARVHRSIIRSLYF